jgi:CRP/FNR family cyclic AMP-dependent transcriptional regulator
MMHPNLKEISFEPGDFLFNEGDSTFHFYIIQSGQVEVFRGDAKKNRIPLALVDGGQPIGEFAMIDRQPRSASAQALTKVQAVLVSEEAYQSLFQDLPTWAQSVMQALVERIRRANEVILSQSLVDEKLKTRIASAEFDPDITATEIDLGALRHTKK